MTIQHWRKSKMKSQENNGENMRRLEEKLNVIFCAYVIGGLIGLIIIACGF